MTDIERAIGHLERIAKALDRAAQEAHGLSQVIHSVKSADAQQAHDINYQTSLIQEYAAKLHTFALMGKMRA